MRMEWRNSTSGGFSLLTGVPGVEMLPEVELCVWLTLIMHVGAS